MNDLDIGAVLAGRYVVVASLRAGGMGAVYRAVDKHFQGREVALKRMLEPETVGIDFDTLHARFVEEANVLVGLSHPGVPQVYDLFSEEGSHYIVMEFIHGDSLDTLLEEYIQFTAEPMPPSEAVHYALQVAEVLTYLHGREPKAILHRDVKPANIVRNRDTRRAVLVDFGLARGGNTGVTLATAVGTLGYASYEQVVGKPEPRSDIYALGATLWHLVTGKIPPPFEIPLLHNELPEADGDLARLVDWATRAEIERRPPSAAVYAEELRTLKTRLSRGRLILPVLETPETRVIRPSGSSTQELDGLGPPAPEPVDLEPPFSLPIKAILAGILGGLAAIGVMALVLQAFNHPPPPAPAPVPVITTPTHL